MSGLDTSETRRLDHAARALSIAASNSIGLMDACLWYRGRGARGVHRDAWRWLTASIMRPGAVRGPLRMLFAEAEARIRVRLKNRRRRAYRLRRGGRRG